MKTFATSLTLVLGVLLAHNAQAQNMEETVSKLSGEAAKRYVAPIVSGFGSNLNSGWYHKAPAPKKFGFNVEGGVIAMGTLLGGAAKTFHSQGEFTFSGEESDKILSFIDTDPKYSSLSSAQKQELKDSLKVQLAHSPTTVIIRGPTITGSEDDTVQILYPGKVFTTTTQAGIRTDTVPPDTTSLNGVTGLLGDLPALPLFAPQLTIGTIYGTNLTLRWLPETETTDEVGTVKFFGFGIQHNPSVWLGSKPPIDISFGYFQQKLEVGTLFEASSWAAGVNVSKTLGWRFLNVTPYGGVQYESSTMKFSYERELTTPAGTETIPIHFELEGENKYRATAGLSVRLLAVNINADYSLAKYSSFSAGVMVGI